MFGLFRKKEAQYGGIIASLGLIDFWRSLSEDDRQFIRVSYASGFTDGDTLDLKSVDHPKSTATMRRHSSFFLYSYSAWAMNAKRYALARRMITESLRLNPPPIDRHFTYNTAIELTYKMRDIDPEAITDCIAYCLADIELIPEFQRDWQTQFPEDKSLPRIPAFQRLAIISEKRGNYIKAIAISELALKYGQDDGTKGGFTGRIDKLRKKLK